MKDHIPRPSALASTGTNPMLGERERDRAQQQQQQQQTKFGLHAQGGEALVSLSAFGAGRLRPDAVYDDI